MYESAAPSPSPVNSTVDPVPFVYAPPAEFVFVVVFEMIVPLFVKVPLMLAARVPVPIIMVPLLVRAWVPPAEFVIVIVGLLPSGMVVPAIIVRVLVLLLVKGLLIVKRLKTTPEASIERSVLVPALPSMPHVTVPPL